MNARPDIPRIGPAANDGSGLGGFFPVTYRFDDDDRDRLAALAEHMPHRKKMRLVGNIVAKERRSEMNLRRDRERAMLSGQLRGLEPFWLPCPACHGHGVGCHVCKGRAFVSDLFAETWNRQGA